MTSPWEVPNKPDKELTLEQKIEILEVAPLERYNKLNLALLLLDRKKGAQLGYFVPLTGRFDPNGIVARGKDAAERIGVTLKDMQLEFVLQVPPEVRDEIFGYSYLVAKNKETLAQVVAADMQNDDKAFGLLMGYPPTAVEAYLTPEAFDYETELPQEEQLRLEEEKVLLFKPFKSSRGHWAEELEYARENQRLIQEKFPKLYAELMAEKSA